MPAQVPSIGAPRRGEVEDRVAQAPAVDELAHRRGLAAGQDEPVETVEIGRAGAPSRAVDTERVEHRPMLGEGTLDGEDPDRHDGTAVWPDLAPRYQPRTASRSSTGTDASSRPRIGEPRSRETSATIRGSS